jgi:hypothetical protein
MQRRVLKSHKIWTLLGVLAAVIVAVNANVLVARYYTRWDLTSSGLYTLSHVTKQTLASLDAPVEITVFLGRSDPLHGTVRQMLTAYGAETAELRTRFVDPDRNPAEFMALQSKYDIVAGKTEDGRLLTDTAIIVARGERHWFVTHDDIVRYDGDRGEAEPRLEQALTEGIRNVLERDKPKVCFTAGHQELSIDDVAPTGLAELRFRLEKGNFEPRTVDLSPPIRKSPLAACDVAVVVAPQIPFANDAARELERHLERGGSTLLLLNPVLDDDGRIRSSGLEPVARLGGITLGDDMIVEADAAFRLPSGLGESFFAAPVSHPITEGLLRGDDPAYRLLFSTAQSLGMASDHSGAAPKALAKTSERAFSVSDVRPFVEGKAVPGSDRAKRKGPFTLGYAAELPRRPDQPAPAERGARLVVVGTDNIAWTRSLRDPSLFGNRLLLESAFGWLAARPPLVSVPAKPAQSAGLALSEDALGEVWRYVLVYMPGAALLLGLYVLMRRRAHEKRSRRDSTREDAAS